MNNYKGPETKNKHLHKDVVTRRGDVVVQLPSYVQLFVTPWTAACQASLSLTISWSWPKFMPSHPLKPSYPSALNLTSISDFSSELPVYIRWPKYWSISLSICLFNKYSGLISLKTDWFDLLVFQGTFRHLLKHHSVKAYILWHSA